MPVSSTNKTDCHDITGILLKVALNSTTITLLIQACLCLLIIGVVFKENNKKSLKIPKG
jgi:hypothetical protein